MKAIAGLLVAAAAVSPCLAQAPVLRCDTAPAGIASMTWPLSSVPIRVLDMMKFRQNPDRGHFVGPVLHDSSLPCKVNIVTQRGEFGFVYGYKAIEGKVYLVGNLADPDTPDDDDDD
ncbi:MAG TPA: hypothetical protein VJK90_09245 [Acetobacteraceae bacterium]|jgi:hypothetical protein|nr:hypothetical protein [Acetobacteraceae bacterium]